MDQNFPQAFIGGAVESYTKVMSTLLNGSNPFSPTGINLINSRLVEKYEGALRDTLNTDEYNEALRLELQTAFNNFKEMNEFNIEGLHRNASQVIHKLKMKYSGDMEDLLDANSNGMEEEDLQQAHEDAVKVLKKLLEKELVNKVRVNEPIEPHWESLKLHTNKYFRSIEDTNQENIENATRSNKKVAMVQKKVDTETIPPTKYEAQPRAGDSYAVDTNNQTKFASSFVEASSYALSSSKKDEYPDYARNTKKTTVVVEKKTDIQPKPTVVFEKKTDIQSKPSIKYKLPAFGVSEQPVLPYKTEEYSSIETIQKGKPALPNKTRDWRNNSFESNSAMTSKLPISKPPMIPCPPNKYKDATVQYTVNSKSQPIQFTKPMSPPPPEVQLGYREDGYFPSRYENAPTTSKKEAVNPSAPIYGATSHSHNHHHHQPSFAQQSVPKTGPGVSASLSIPLNNSLLISLTPHDVTIGIRLQDSFSTLENEFGEHSTKMEIAQTKTDTFIYGSSASQSIRDSFKQFWSLEECFMWGKTPWSASVMINGKLRQLRGEMVIGYILKKLKLAAERQLKGRTCWEVLIAVPNWFESVDRNLVEDAAKAAGFTSVKLVNQLSALALRHIESAKRKGVGTPSNFLIFQKYQNFIYAAAYGADSTLEKVYLLGHCMEKYEKKQMRPFFSWNAKIRDRHEKEATKLIKLVHTYALQMDNYISPTVLNDLADRSWHLHPTFVMSDTEDWIGRMQGVVKGEMITKTVNDVMTGLAYLAPKLNHASVKTIISDDKTLITNTAHEKNNFPRCQVDEIARIIKEMEISGQC